MRLKLAWPSNMNTDLKLDRPSGWAGLAGAHMWGWGCSLPAFLPLQLASLSNHPSSDVAASTGQPRQAGDFCTQARRLQAKPAGASSCCRGADQGAIRGLLRQEKQGPKVKEYLSDA